jgi:hypothetical protein
MAFRLPVICSETSFRNSLGSSMLSAPMCPASAFQTRPEDESFDYTFDHLVEQRQAAEVFGSGGVQGPFIPNAAEICR